MLPLLLPTGCKSVLHCEQCEAQLQQLHNINAAPSAQFYKTQIESSIAATLPPPALHCKQCETQLQQLNNINVVASALAHGDSIWHVLETMPI